MPQPLNRTTAPIAQIYPEKIVQFGGGNFLRAFVDWMVEVLNAETDFNGRVVVVKASPPGQFGDAHDALAQQEGLYHLLLTRSENGQAVSDTRLITSISRVLNPHRDYAAYVALAQQPHIRFIVSNTTEAGIVFDDDDRLDDQPPVTFPAKLTRFLYERYRHFAGAEDKGCIMLPCELIEQNGDRLRHCVLAYAALWQLGDAFTAWLANTCLFCNTLVDRIVPGYPHDRAAAIQAQIGFEDKLLVEAEQYHTWVIEAPDWLQDAFPAEKAGLHVTFVDDVRPYRELKVRILNGAHTAMVPVGYLAGWRTVREAVEDEVVGRFITRLLFDEVLPTLDFPAAIREQMAQDTLARFRNPYLKHQLITIALNTTAKFKTRLLPSLLRRAAQTGQAPPRLSLALAAFMRFYRGEWQGQPIALQDEAATLAWWRAMWQVDLSPAERVTQVLGHSKLWQQDLTAVPGLHTLVTHYLTLIESDGIQAALREIDD